MKQKFKLGQVVATPGAVEVLAASGQEPMEFVQRHMSGDWGCVCPDDAELNELALKDGTRLLSAYRTAKGVKFWLITEADRSATTILLPDEY